MNYNFPHIEFIDDVLPAIEGRDEFVVADKGPYTVINYNVGFEDTFPPVNTYNDAVRRECRGIIFDSYTRQVIARRPHKFFNVNERQETRTDKLPTDKNHVILDKLDGSMITPFLTSDGILRWGTKMGETDISAPVEWFVADNPQYHDLALQALNLNFTPCFEWCSRQNRVVLDHPEDKLVLLLIRENHTGNYMPYDEMVEYAKSHNVDYVGAADTSVDDFEKFLGYIRSLEGIEGVVVRYDDGHMVKMKTEEYMQLHKTLSFLSFEKDVLRLVVDNKTDDLKSILDDSTRYLLEEYEQEVLTNLEHKASHIHWAVQSWVDNEGISKKKFATEFVKNSDNDKVTRGILFNVFRDGENVMNESEVFNLLLETVKKNTISSTKVENVRHLIGTRWTYGE